MKFCFLAFCFLCFFQSGRAQGSASDFRKLKEGDILFQHIPCGDLCQAIVETTPCQAGLPFNHCGIVAKANKEWVVVEAIGKQVKVTPLHLFFARDTSQRQYLGRLHWSKRALKQSVEAAKNYIGRPYDDQFLPGDAALYCSELVYDCYKEKSRPVFSLQPMTFKSPHTGKTYPAWTEYYQHLGAPIPEGLPGINPCAIANNTKLHLFFIDKASLKL
ncbi:MAG: hypothetical protein JST36_00935 [Bacteroidetes bacterium]|nr:hypothetical protein [Bacteroidota bacterium]